jgi:hypothetical protein
LFRHCRRVVKQIEKTADGYFNITVEHWEPQEYLEAMDAQRKKDKEANVLYQAVSALMMGLAGAAIVTQIILPEPDAQEKYGHLLQQLPGNRPYMQVIFPLLALAVALIVFVISKPAPAKGIADTPVPPSVGTGGSRIGIEEMKLGGSGSAAIMNGRIVGRETIRTRFVVNAAGNYSDKIAAMIGDNSFTIQPRIGNYLLLHRNQVGNLIPVLRLILATAGLSRHSHSLPLPPPQTRKRS